MNLITRYIIALTNLYGILHKDKVIEIYNLQNSDTISNITINKKTVVIDDIIIKEDVLNDKLVYIYKDYFAHEALVVYKDHENLLSHQKGKPYYVPAKNELLKYEDDFYFEMTLEYKKLVKYIKSKIVMNNDIFAENICNEIQFYTQSSASFTEIFKVFERNNILLKDLQQAQEVSSLITQLSNNTRIWENNGHTPNEISKLMGKSRLRPLPVENPSTFINDNKTGRNDPCPCGSGKKYKNCCLNKDDILQ